MLQKVPLEKTMPLDSDKGEKAETTTRAPARSWTLRLLGLVIALCFAAVAFSGLMSRETDSAKLKESTAALAISTVKIAPPITKENTDHLDLPGRLEAFARAPLFGRVSGYVTSWKADIGSHVKAGDLLAEIEAPELDQQLVQAESDLVNMETNAKLSEVTNKRYQALLPNNTISRQTADEKAADFAAKTAQVNATRANVDRLKALSAFKRIVAPFDGVVVERNTDLGALINSGSATGLPLFVVADTQRLRLYVNVPQNYVTAVKPGTNATVVVPERPGETFTATVERSSQSIDVVTGATRMQLLVDNAKGELLPGGYASVQLDIGRGIEAIRVPASAIIFDKGGVRVAIVDADSKIVLKDVKIGRDLGKIVEITSGLTAADRVVESPPDGVQNGELVHIHVSDEQKQNPPAK